MIPLPRDFKEFLSLLNTNRVEYLLIGGYAVNYHGYPRATVDLDVWISTNAENARRVEAALGQFGCKAPLDQILDPRTMLRMGGPVSIINLADLLRNKTASGRPKDLADIGELPAG